MRGLEAIRAWNASNIKKYQVKTEPTAVREADGKMIVTAQVSGTFDGSPIELEFAFTIAGAKIQTLAID